MPSLNDDLISVIAKHIAQMDVYILCHGIGLEDYAAIKELYHAGVITDELIDNSLDKAVRTKARKYYEILVSEDAKRRDNLVLEYPDHLAHQEIFAYALAGKEFTDSEIDMLRFDHGQNTDSYIETYGNENLILDFRKTLLGLEEKVGD